MKKLHRIGLFVASASAAGLLSAGSSQAAMMSLGADADTYVRDNLETRGTLNFIDVRGFAAADFVGYIRFDLSGLNIIDVQNATLSLYRIAGSRNDGITNARHEVQGLLNLAGNTPQDWIESGTGALNTTTAGLDYNVAAANSVDLTRVVNLDADDGAMITEVTAAAPAPTTITGADLVSFLNGRVDDGGLVTFIVSINANNDRGYGFGSKENADTTLHPHLDLEFTAVPEPASVLLMVIGGLALAARRRAG